MANTKVQSEQIADDAIDSEHYTDGSIDTAHIADAQITVAKMAANSVDSDQYVDGSIDTVHLGDLQVTTAKIANGNISTAKIADNAVTSAKLDTNIAIAGDLTVQGGQINTGNTSGDHSEFGTDGSGHTFIDASTSGGSLLLQAGGTTKVTMNSSGSVGIGTTSPEGALHVHGGDSGSSYSADGADKFILEHSDSVAIDIRTPATNQALIMFSDGTRSQGLIGYDHNEDSLRFHTNNSEKVKIDANGQVVFKGYAGGDGFHTPFDQHTGYTNHINAGGFGVLARNQYDSYITGNLYYHKTGGTAAWKNKYSGKGCSVISLVQNAGNQGAIKFITTNQSTSSSGESMTLLNVAMMDSDGLKFGGDTSSANALDDYEEGTCTMSIVAHNGGSSVSVGSNSGTYTKIGNVCTVSWYSSASTVSNAGNGIMRIDGFPFSAANTTAHAVGAVTHVTSGGNAFWSSSDSVTSFYINPNATTAYPIKDGTTSGVALVTGSSKYIMITVTYRTT